MHYRYWRIHCHHAQSSWCVRMCQGWTGVRRCGRRSNLSGPVRQKWTAKNKTKQIKIDGSISDIVEFYNEASWWLKDKGVFNFALGLHICCQPATRVTRWAAHTYEFLYRHTRNKMVALFYLKHNQIYDMVQSLRYWKLKTDETMKYNRNRMLLPLISKSLFTTNFIRYSTHYT